MGGVVGRDNGQWRVNLTPLICAVGIGGTARAAG